MVARTFSITIASAQITGLIGTATSSTTIRLDWNAYPGATGYEIRRGTPGQLVHTITDGSTTWTNSSYSASTTYTLRVRPVVGGVGVASAEASVNVTTPLLAASFTDDFSSGNLSKVENGIRWGGGAYTEVVSGFGRSGNNCLRFNFQPGAESWAEQRFDLGADYSDVTIDFYIYYPIGTESPTRGPKFVHRSGQYASNNKFFRLWRGDPSDGSDGYSSTYVKYGASTGSQGGVDENIYVEWGGNFGGTGPGGASGQGTGASASNYLTDAYRGRWIPIKIRCKVATVPNTGFLGNGIVQVWRDGVQIMNATQLDSWVTVSGGVNKLRHGYLLGYANSGFAQLTHAYIDDVAITVIP